MPRHLLRRPIFATLRISALVKEVDEVAYIGLRVHFHFRHHFVVFHILLANIPAILHSLNPFAQFITLDGPSLDRGFGHKNYRHLRNESLPWTYKY